jgi:hypothetical protein
LVIIYTFSELLRIFLEKLEAPKLFIFLEFNTDIHCLSKEISAEKLKMLFVWKFEEH